MTVAAFSAILHSGHLGSLNPSGREAVSRLWPEEVVAVIPHPRALPGPDGSPGGPFLPADLIALQRRFDRATRALVDFGRCVNAERRTAFPRGDQWRERMWPDEGPEMQELERLRAERHRIGWLIRSHPAADQAWREGSWPAIKGALRNAARQHKS